MKIVNGIKDLIIAFVGALSGFLGILYVPVMLLLGCNIVDYITGLCATKKRGVKLSSYRSIAGIFKKVGMWLLVIVAWILDEVIEYSTESIGLHFHIMFLASCIVAVWLVFNEIISILENLTDIGVPIPAFLMPLVSRLKSTTENIAKDGVEKAVQELSEALPDATETPKQVDETETAETETETTTEKTEVK